MEDKEYYTFDEVLQELDLTREDLGTVEFCEFCGQPLIERKEYVDGDKHFLPVAYMICPDCD